MENRYTLDDIHEIMDMEQSPLTEFRDFPDSGKEASPQTVWYLLHRMWDDALKKLLEDNYTSFPCATMLQKILFMDFEDLPLYLEKPKYCPSKEWKPIGNSVCDGDCCQKLVRWRLERGR